MTKRRAQRGQIEPGAQHPPEYVDDLNPERLAGQNVGIHRPGPTSDVQRSRSAYDVKDVHDRLQGMDDDILKQIPILPTGSRLEQGATYIDLALPEPTEFTGGGGQTVREGALIVPKDRCDYNIWNRLIGVNTSERLGVGSEP